MTWAFTKTTRRAFAAGSAGKIEPAAVPCGRGKAFGNVPWADVGIGVIERMRLRRRRRGGWGLRVGMRGLSLRFCRTWGLSSLVGGTLDVLRRERKADGRLSR